MTAKELVKVLGEMLEAERPVIVREPVSEEFTALAEAIKAVEEREKLISDYQRIHSYYMQLDAAFSSLNEKSAALKAKLEEDSSLQEVSTNVLQSALIRWYNSLSNREEERDDA